MKIAADWNADNPAFRRFYGWDDDAGTWQIRYSASPAGYALGLHVFCAKSVPEKPKEPVGTLFIIHGYLEHGALRVPAALEAVRAGWQACALDLPGHGFSGGARADIGDFDEYGRAVQAVLAAENWPRPWRILAHSTGCAATLLYIKEHGNPFDGVVMEAPLVRTFLWKPSLVARRLLRGAVDTLPRRNAGLDRDKLFYRQLKADPFYMSKVPLGWFDALETYEGRTAAWGILPGRYLILQGAADTVVDKNYNLPFLQQHLAEVEIVTIPGGRHHLLRDEGPAGILARRALRQAWY